MKAPCNAKPLKEGKGPQCKGLILFSPSQQGGVEVAACIHRA